MSQFFTSGGHSIGVSANSRLMIILPQCYTSVISVKLKNPNKQTTKKKKKKNLKNDVYTYNDHEKEGDATIWISLEEITLNETNQLQKDKPCMISFI